MGIYTTAIEKLYVAYFNRPADVAGLTFWEGVVAKANGSTAAVSAEFAKSAEYKAAYAGMDEYHVVAQVYQNLFGRAPEPAGLNFWGQALINKAMTIDNVVTQIAAGAQGSDLVAYNNKVAAATAFTAALDTSAEILAYSGDKANAVAKQFISGITDDASLKAAIAEANLNAVVQSVVDNGPQPAGETFTLTQGMDTIVGTVGNDTINVYAFNPTTGVATSNLNTFDSIDGSAGKDTLNIQISGGHNVLADLGTVKNVEIVNITADVAQAVDASKFAGATAINQLGTAGAVTNLAVGTTAGFNGTATEMDVTAAGASAAVSFTNVDEAAALFVDGASLTTVTVSGTRADTDSSDDIAALDLHVQVAKDAQKVTVTTNQLTTLTVDETVGSAKHVATVDASASTGGINLDATGNTNILNVSTGSGDDSVTVVGATLAATSTAAAVNATVSTGAGVDTITISNTGTGLTTVDAGAGNDIITLNKADGAALNVQGGEGNDIITINGTLATTDIVNGGAGTDIVAVAGKTARVADDYIVFNKLITGFETIKFTTTETALDASQLSAGYTTIDLASGSAVTGVGSQALTARGALTATASGYSVSSSGAVTYGGTLNITEKAAGTVTAKADTVNLTVKATAGADLAAILAGDVKTANVTVSNAVTTDGTADHLGSVSVTTSSSALTKLATLTITGSGAATVSNTGGALVTVDASAQGGTLVSGAATAGLTYSSTNAAAETVKLGAGIDHVTIGNSVYGKVDTVSGLTLKLNSAGTALTASSDMLNVTGVTTATKFTTTQTDIDFALKDAAAGHTAVGTAVVFQFGGDTYVYQDNGTAGSVDSADVLVKLTGTIDLDAVIKSLATPIV